MISNSCICVFFWLCIASPILCDHYYCSIFRNDAVNAANNGNPWNSNARVWQFFPNDHGMSWEEAKIKFPHEEY